MLKYVKKHKANTIMGDFNSKLGRGRVEDLIEIGFEVGERNEREDRLLQFCQEENMKVTWLRLLPRRLYT